MVCNLKINRVFANGTYSNANVAGTNSIRPTSGDRKYDVWGAVRGGNPTGYPNNRYCANLGHVVDDELGLIYMRARYYEPGTGRFISEDPAMDGLNWYSYCSSDPLNGRDFTGLWDSDSVSDVDMRKISALGGLLTTIGTMIHAARDADKLVKAIAITQLSFLIAWFGFIRDPDNAAQSNLFEMALGGALMYGCTMLIVDGMVPKPTDGLSAKTAVTLLLNHAAFLFTFMQGNEIASDYGY
jgi:RHS repeat-associated protein